MNCEMMAWKGYVCKDISECKWVCPHDLKESQTQHSCCYKCDISNAVCVSVYKRKKLDDFKLFLLRHKFRRNNIQNDM